MLQLYGNTVAMFFYLFHGMVFSMNVQYIQYSLCICVLLTTGYAKFLSSALNVCNKIFQIFFSNLFIRKTKTRLCCTCVQMLEFFLLDLPFFGYCSTQYAENRMLHINFEKKTH